MDNQVTSLTVGINSGNADQRIDALERALLALYNAGNQASTGVQNVGDTAQRAGGVVSTLAQVTSQAVNQTNSLSNTASNANSNVGALSRALGNVSAQANSLTQSANNANNSVNGLGTAAGTATAQAHNARQAIQTLLATAAASGASPTAINNLNNSLQHLGNTYGAVNAGQASFGSNLAAAHPQLVTNITKLKAYALGFGALATSIAGATAAGLAFVNSQIETVDELTKVARIANTTVAEIQKYKFGAQTMGVEMDKLGDIFKDTQDKIGDYLTTGGGELQDFFTIIAPKIGITAEQLRGLSGDKALGAVYNALEKSNLSYSEQVFYMESIADEASLLIPMLRKNGEGFKYTYEQAEKYGAVLSDEAIKKTQELKAITGLLGTQFEGLKASVASELIPVLTDLANVLGTDKTLKNEAREATRLFIDTLKIFINTGIGVVGILRAMGTGVGTYAAAWKTAWTSPTQALQILREGWNDIQAILNDTDKRMEQFASLGRGATDPAVESMVKLMAGVNNTNAAYEKLISTQKKLIGYAGDTGVGSTHVHIENDKHGKGSNKYGEAIPQDILNGILVGGKPLLSYVKTSSIGDPRPGYRHKGIDFAGNGIKNGMAIESTLAIKSIKPIQGGRGGFGLTYTLADGRSFTIYHQTPDAFKVPNMYMAGGSKTGSQITAEINAAKEAEKKAKEAKDKFDRDQYTRMAGAVRTYNAIGGYDIVSKMGLDPKLAIAMMATESGGDVNARSPAGALGLMQLKKDAATDALKAMGLNKLIQKLGDPAKDPRLDPKTSLQMWGAYMKILLKQFNGDINKAVYAYNAGAGTVKNRGVGATQENRDYGQRVSDSINKQRNLSPEGRETYMDSWQEGRQALANAQQEAARSFDDVANSFKSFEQKADAQLEAALTKIQSDGEKAGKSQADIDAIKDKMATANNFLKMKFDAELRAQVAGDNVSARARNKNEYLNSFYNMNPELRMPGREKELETYLANIAKVKEIKDELISIATLENELEAKKAFISKTEYENQKNTLSTRRIQAENYNDNELMQSRLNNLGIQHKLAINNILKENAQQLLSMKHIQMTDEARITETARLERLMVAANDELKIEKLKEIDFNERQQIAELNLARREMQDKTAEAYAIAMKNSSNEILRTDLENIRKKWAFQVEREALSKGRELNSTEKSYYDAQKNAEIVTMQRGKLDAVTSMLSGLSINSDPLGALKKQYEERLKIIKDAEDNEVDLTKDAADAKLQVEREYALARANLLFGNFNSVFSGLVNLTRGFAGEQSKTYKAMFYAEKAFNFAGVMLNSFGAMAKAWNSAPFPANLVAVGTTAAQTGVLQAAVQAITPKGFMSGGYTGKGGVTDVAGLVHKEEFVFNAQATKNIGVDNLYALSQGKSFGNVNVVVNNNAPVDVTTRKLPNGGVELNINPFANLANPDSYESRMLRQHTTARAYY